MNPETLATLFGLNHQVLQVNMKDITHKESLFQPPGAGNCINWVLGHIAVQRDSVLRLLGQEPIWPDSESASYVRGSKPMTDDAAAVPTEKILRNVDLSQDRISTGLSKITQEQLSAASPEGTLAEKLAMLHFHEAYHVGQIGLLRRLVGKEGAIR